MTTPPIGCLIHKDTDADKAIENFNKAIALAKTNTDKRGIQRKIDQL